MIINEPDDEEIEVEVTVRADSHRLTFRAVRARRHGEDGYAADTARAVRTALAEASDHALDFVIRAYPTKPGE